MPVRTPSSRACIAGLASAWARSWATPLPFYVSKFEAAGLSRDPGLPVVPARVVRGRAAALAAAQAMGAPVALKILSPDIEHKTEAGGGKLNLNQSKLARAACALIRRSLPFVAGDAVAAARAGAPLRNANCPRNRVVFMVYLTSIGEPKWSARTRFAFGTTVPQ